MTRADLLKQNAMIFKTQGQIVNKIAASDLKVLVVGNPCNTNCMIAMHNAPDVPRDRFFAMMMLDENRARYLLTEQANVNLKAVTNLHVWGNHSSTLFPDFFHAKINNKTAVDFLNSDWLKSDFLLSVRNRGATIIKTRGKSSGASAAVATFATLKYLFNDTKTGENYSLACCSNGEYGVDPGLIYSFPCYTENGIVKIVENIKHEDQFALRQLQITLDEMRNERNIVKELGFLV